MSAEGALESAEVPARPRWVDTGIHLTGGETYLITATGTWQDWRNRCGPEGYPSNSVFLSLAEWARRERGAPWFALIGSIGRRRSLQFVIGASTTFTPDVSGELTCFANDAPLFRWNNKCAVTVTVRRPGDRAR